MIVSILVPVKKDNNYLRECIENCLRLDYSNFEIIVLPDEFIDLPYGDKVSVFPTGKVGPAQKRDMVIDKTKGKILAFLDDDTFPRSDWLKNAIGYFKDENIAAVCGPAVTPEGDNLKEKASGLVYSSFLASGPHNRRYLPQHTCEVDDYPSCNFIIRKDVFKKIGGFDTKFWPGEDTILCLKITKELRKKIIYGPNVLLYHHRRPLFLPHLKQIRSYALHRGYFVKKFPKTSLRIGYFIPSLFVLGLIAGGPLAIFNPHIRVVYFSIIYLYLILDLIYSLRHEGFILKSLVFFGIIATHITYGFYFVKGLLARQLAEE